MSKKTVLIIGIVALILTIVLAIVIKKFDYHTIICLVSSVAIILISRSNDFD
jgi:hypothetical protein